jgi:hypothetical protein
MAHASSRPHDPSTTGPANHMDDIQPVHFTSATANGQINPTSKTTTLAPAMVSRADADARNVRIAPPIAAASAASGGG